MPLSERPVLLISYRTPLAVAGVYDSAWIQVRLHPVSATATSIPQFYSRARVRGFVVADVASAANGFQIQGAMSNTQTDSFPMFQQALAANQVTTFSVEITAKWLRVELTNGGTVQTVLSIFASLENT